MSAPLRPKLLPNTSHQTCRYEVDILDNASQQWYLAHMRKSLEGAKAAKKRIDDRGGWHTRLVVVSEIRRLVEDPRPSAKPLENPDAPDQQQSPEQATAQSRLSNFLD